MPDAPKLPCKHPGCPALSVGSQWCDEHRKNRKQYSNREPRANSHDRGYDYDWRKFRASYLRANPLCVDCLTTNRPEPATEVHHITKLRVAPERKFDPTNLMALCRTCHQKRTAAGE